MEKQSEKFEAIVNAAKSLFWKHGIRRVSIEEICLKAGVSKMTCYKYFRNKTAIVKYLIEDLFETGMEAYMEILNSNIPYDEKVKKTIELKISNAHELSQELIDDIYKYKDSEIDKTIETVKNKMLHIYLDDFRKAQKTGEIRADIKPEFIVYSINRLTEMVTDERLVSIYPDPEHMIAEVMSFFFYGIMPAKKEKK
ncbi:MAG: TetR/AcrR family transcriptional regulator [Bacteroidia bacterium]|nr:TetR/AcrR family transcriptional regulator [Bacteroidia bacterium]